MKKCPWEKTVTVFAIFHSTMNLFLQIMTLSISNISLQKCYSESFTVSSYFPLKKRKFSPQMFSCIRYVIDCVLKMYCCVLCFKHDFPMKVSEKLLIPQPDWLQWFLHPLQHVAIYYPLPTCLCIIAYYSVVAFRVVG